MSATEVLKKTPLYEEHIALKARMIPFGGWLMPVQYEGILSEHQSTRQEAALFDISHMGEFLVEGHYKETGLDRILTQAIGDMPLKSSRYGMILNDNGHVIDDLIVFRLEEEKWFVVVNGATTEKDAQHFKNNLTSPVCFKNVSQDLGKIDIQGPASRDILKSFVEGIEKLNYFEFDQFDLLGENVLISRTGYTGELGYEIFYPWEKTKDLWQKLLENDRVKAAGLGARDVLRIEVGYSLYGHEITEDISPMEAGLTRFIDFSKDFIGKEAVVKQKENGVEKKLIGFKSGSRRSPRVDHKIYNAEKKEIGSVTSGTFSPSLNAGIGLGYIQTDQYEKDAGILIGNEKNQFKATITGKIFFKSDSLKS